MEYFSAIIKFQYIKKIVYSSLSVQFPGFDHCSVVMEEAVSVFYEIHRKILM